MAGFLQAMALVQLPSINFVYADKDSNIAFIHNAQYPNRIDNWDWSKGLPGNRSDLIWQGYRKFAQVPKLINPESGLVFNANNTPFNATDGGDNLSPENFPQSMGLATNQTNRSLRLMELNDGVSLLGETELLKQKFDVTYSPESDYLITLNQVLAQDWSDDINLVKAQSLIKAWDRQADIENRHTAISISILRELHQNKDKEDRAPAVLREAAKRAVSYLQNNYGRLDPQWGDVNRLKRGRFDQAVDGGPDALRAIYSLGYEPDQKAFATAGDTWMALVSWDTLGQQKAKVLHQFGSATLDQQSLHYADQAELFVNHQWREATFDIEQIRQDSTRSYLLGDRLGN
jgi:penicillin amidase/acyl-homoserine-lactone acylase